MTNAENVRLYADLAPDVANALKALAASQGVSLCVALSRAISTESWIVQRTQQGAKILLDDRRGNLAELVFAR